METYLFRAVTSGMVGRVRIFTDLFPKIITIIGKKKKLFLKNHLKSLEIFLRAYNKKGNISSRKSNKS